MVILARLLLIAFLPIFIGSIIFFVLLLNLSDLFFNIVRYLEQEVSFSQLLKLQYLFLPQCIVYALPISLLFSVSYSMGSLYANNELIAVFASGISLRRFIVPLVIAGVLFSASLFVLQDNFAIPMLKEKENLSMQLLRNQPINLDQSNVSIQSLGGRVIYHAGYYDSVAQRLTDVTVLVRTEDLLMDTHIYADWAEWTDSEWKFHDVTLIRKPLQTEGDDARPEFSIMEKSVHSQPELNLPPDNFQNQFGDIDEMNLQEARNYVNFLRDSGFPFRKDLTKYHERYSFALTPLIVTLLSAAIGGRYRKNILGVSLLVSLGLSVVYYCAQLLSALLATVGFINSVTGAWAGTFLTGAAAIYLLYKAKT